MKIAIVAGGFTPGEADKLRRAMATFKRTGTIGTFKVTMVEGMVARGYEREFAERCFSQIEGFGEYGFPESHAASFALLVYASSWLKCRYPDAFAAALINSQPMGFYAPSQIVRDVREHGVEVRPVDVNRSDWDATLEPGLPAAAALASEASGQRGHSISARAGHSPEPGSSARVLDLPSTVGGLAFAPKGFRLAVAHYHGVTLWYPNAREAEPEKLEWKGSHLGVALSPDGKFLVTTMQEPTLHGWRLADSKDMRMSGYGARVRSLGWTVGGKWLATSGSNQLILWPFQGNDGPMGKTPQLLAPYEAQVEVVACHPRQEVVAVGYADGLVLIVRLGDGAEVLARAPAGAPVTALAWGTGMLAFGTEDGQAGVLDL